MGVSPLTTFAPQFNRLYAMMGGYKPNIIKLVDVLFCFILLLYIIFSWFCIRCVDTRAILLIYSACTRTRDRR